MTSVVEIRTYELKPGSQLLFNQIFEQQVLPMLSRWGHDVVHAAPSPHGCDTFVLIRAYESEEDRHSRQDTFYGSREWRDGPRKSVLDLIQSFTSGVVPISAATLAAWRRDLAAARAT